MKLLNRAESGLLFEALVRDHTLLFPVRRDSKLYLATSDKVRISEVVVGEVRTVDPLKALFFLGREFRILDKVFLDPEYGDPTYGRLRESSVIISSDCTCAIETCFCVAAGGRPWPEEGFDLNLSPVDEGFIVEEGTEKGREIVRKHAGFFGDPSPEQLALRSKNREAVAEQVRGFVASSGTPDQSLLEGSVMKEYESAVWAEEASTCVECGACNTVCPTCHCFFLYDRNGPGGPARFRAWDSCLIKDFARVAGGANPRKALWMRLRNRFEKKFDFFRKVAGQYACTGCGRCISACPGKIDIRKVLKRLAEGNGR
jgi:sulfhydrogenase subunit beta (sulfur reductase)